jgi:hypothetical protein
MKGSRSMVLDSQTQRSIRHIVARGSRLEPNTLFSPQLWREFGAAMAAADLSERKNRAAVKPRGQVQGNIANQRLAGWL